MKDKTKIKNKKAEVNEPFPSGYTPNPPQVINPSEMPNQIESNNDDTESSLKKKDKSVKK